MAKNNNLHNAKATKNDEFYTRLEDIENELKYYKDYFNGKVVYCNCDDFLRKERNNFFVYFSLNYEFFGLKGLICTKYNPNGRGIKYEYYGDYPDEEEIFASEMEGDGDFRSEECIELLKKCDIVCTNPPFSLFRQYIAQLFEYKKDFLIIGNMNAISYKEVFPLIKENKLWLGVKSLGSDMFFNVPDEYKDELMKTKTEGSGWRIIDGSVKARVASACWFTNLDHKKRHEELLLYKKYNSEEYPKYDNYNAIEVSKVTDIPMDYDGVMGVPITFLNKYCPTQFEIIGLDRYVEDNPNYGHRFNINGKEKYARILIKRIS